MSALMKKHHTEEVINISWNGNIYAVPIKIIEHYKINLGNNDYIPTEDLFNDLIEKSGESGVLLKGLRYREGFTQKELAKKLNISQTNLSAMENGKRNIGKDLAKRIAEIFKLNYRIFL